MAAFNATTEQFVGDPAPRDIEADVRRAEAGFLEPDYDDGDDLRARRGLALAIGLTAVLILAGLVIYSVL